eukprot:5277713-Lingulodinium_polyedra.AAC.1
MLPAPPCVGTGSAAASATAAGSSTADEHTCRKKRRITKRKAGEAVDSIIDSKMQEVAKREQDWIVEQVKLHPELLMACRAVIEERLGIGKTANFARGVTELKSVPLPCAR